MAASPIPIRNVYYLFLYAWDRFPEGQQVEVGTEESPDIVHLLAEVLRNGIRRLIRRGLDRGYREHEEELKAPRGRALLTPSIAQGTLLRQRLVCAYDELTPDILTNRILKAAMRLLVDKGGLEPTLAHDLRALSRRFMGVGEIALSRGLFRLVQLSRHNGHYDLLLRVSEMALEILQPEQGGAGSKFASVLENETRMSAVFELFVRNFLKREQTAYKVSSEYLDWDAGELDARHSAYLPTMRTDVVLRSGAETIVIDAKFYKDTFVRHHGGPLKVRSAHLYQMLTYLDHAWRADPRGRPVRGLLLYPSVDGQETRLDYALGGRQVCIATVDLARPWQHVHEAMLRVVEPALV